MKTHAIYVLAALLAASWGIALAQESGAAAKQAAMQAAQPVTKPATKSATKSATKPAAEILRSCAPCHDLTKARKKRISVPVFGMYGAKPAKASLKIAKWDDKNLDLFLENPRKVDPTSKMFFKVKDPKKRAEMIQAMKTLK